MPVRFHMTITTAFLELMPWGLKAGLELTQCSHVTTGSAIQTNDDAYQNVRIEKIFLHSFVMQWHFQS